MFEMMEKFHNDCCHKKKKNLVKNLYWRLLGILKFLFPQTKAVMATRVDEVALGVAIFIALAV